MTRFRHRGNEPRPQILPFIYQILGGGIGLQVASRLQGLVVEQEWYKFPLAVLLGGVGYLAAPYVSIALAHALIALRVPPRQEYERHDKYHPLQLLY